MDGFKNHYIDGKQWDYNSDMKDEIDSFTADGVVDAKEEKVLKQILDYNIQKKGREKLVLQRTTREKLENLSYQVSFESHISNRINKILAITSDNVEQRNNMGEIIEYFQTQDYNSLKVESRSLGRSKIREIQKIIGAGKDGIFGPATFRKYKQNNPNWENESLSEFLDRSSGISDNSLNVINQGLETTVESTYRTLKAEARSLGRLAIKMLQKDIGTRADGQFGPATFRKYKQHNPNWKYETLALFIENIELGNHEHDTSFVDNTSELARSFYPGGVHYDDGFRNKTDKIISNETQFDFGGNAEFIEGLGLSENYRKIAYDFLSKLKSNEKLAMGTPIALVDSKRKEMAYIVLGEIKYIPVLLGKNGTTTGGYVNKDKKTPKGYIHRFDPSISNLADSPDGDASNSGHSKTVKSASLQSDVSKSFGGRYFHGVAQYRLDGRFEGMGTWGCVGVDVYTIRDMYNDTVRNGIGYGYVG